MLSPIEFSDYKSTLPIDLKCSKKGYYIEWGLLGAQYMMEENLKVVSAEFSPLSKTILLHSITSFECN